MGRFNLARPLRHSDGLADYTPAVANLKEATVVNILARNCNQSRNQLLSF